jgi:L-2-hydroxyglutarate oxidase LhgO
MKHLIQLGDTTFDKGAYINENNLMLANGQRDVPYLQYLLARLAQQPVFALSSRDEIPSFWPHGAGHASPFLRRDALPIQVE